MDRNGLVPAKPFLKTPSGKRGRPSACTLARYGENVSTNISRSRLSKNINIHLENVIFFFFGLYLFSFFCTILLFCVR